MSWRAAPTTVKFIDTSEPAGAGPGDATTGAHRERRAAPPAPPRPQQNLWRHSYAGHSGARPDGNTHPLRDGRHRDSNPVARQPDGQVNVSAARDMAADQSPMPDHQDHQDPPNPPVAKARPALADERAGPRRKGVVAENPANPNTSAASRSGRTTACRQHRAPPGSAGGIEESFGLKAGSGGNTTCGRCLTGQCGTDADRGDIGKIRIGSERQDVEAALALAAHGNSRDAVGPDPGARYRFGQQAGLASPNNSIGRRLSARDRRAAVRQRLPDLEGPAARRLT